jgi:hypothetical protein
MIDADERRGPEPEGREQPLSQAATRLVVPRPWGRTDLFRHS